MSSKKRLPEIALAFKAVREASRISQEAFAQCLQTTSTSVSRIERGLQTPASFDMFNRLERMARDLGLAAEAARFDEARLALRFTAFRPPDRPGPAQSLPQWRLAMAASIAAAYFPEHLPAIEKALQPPLEIVDQILRCTDESEIDYRRMEREVLSCAERAKLRDLKSEASVPQKENH
jgi:transcriptional regulator with XRE-family HTH domain